MDRPRPRKRPSLFMRICCCATTSPKPKSKAPPPHRRTESDVSVIVGPQSPPQSPEPDGSFRSQPLVDLHLTEEDSAVVRPDDVHLQPQPQPESKTASPKRMLPPGFTEQSIPKLNAFKSPTRLRMSKMSSHSPALQHTASLGSLTSLVAASPQHQHASTAAILHFQDLPPPPLPMSPKTSVKGTQGPPILLPQVESPKSTGIKVGVLSRNGGLSPLNSGGSRERVFHASEQAMPRMSRTGSMVLRPHERPSSTLSHKGGNISAPFPLLLSPAATPNKGQSSSKFMPPRSSVKKNKKQASSNKSPAALATAPDSLAPPNDPISAMGLAPTTERFFDVAATEEPHASSSELMREIQTPQFAKPSARRLNAVPGGDRASLSQPPDGLSSGPPPTAPSDMSSPKIISPKAFQTDRQDDIRVPPSQIPEALSEGAEEEARETPREAAAHPSNVQPSGRFPSLLSLAVPPRPPSGRDPPRRETEPPLEVRSPTMSMFNSPSLPGPPPQEQEESESVSSFELSQQPSKADSPILETKEGQFAREARLGMHPELFQSTNSFTPVLRQHNMPGQHNSLKHLDFKLPSFEEQKSIPKDSIASSSSPGYTSRSHKQINTSRESISNEAFFARFPDQPSERLSERFQSEDRRRSQVSTLKLSQCPSEEAANPESFPNLEDVTLEHAPSAPVKATHKQEAPARGSTPLPPDSSEVIPMQFSSPQLLNHPLGQSDQATLMVETHAMLSIQLQAALAGYEALQRDLQRENGRIVALEKEYLEACSAHAKIQTLFSESAALSLLQSPAR